MPQRRLRQLLKGNFFVLDKDEQKMAVRLLAAGHEGLLRHWPRPGVNDVAKRHLIRTACSKLSNIPSATTAERLAILQAPVAQQRPKTLTHHGDTRIDPFYWMRDDERKDPEVLAYIAAENDYGRAVMADTEALQEELYREMRGRIQEADESVAVRRGGYFYYTCTLEGLQYCVRCRRRVPANAGPDTETTTMDTRRGTALFIFMCYQLDFCGLAGLCG